MTTDQAARVPGVPEGEHRDLPQPASDPIAPAVWSGLDLAEKVDEQRGLALIDTWPRTRRAFEIQRDAVHETIVRLSPWSRHHSDCARILSAGPCDCGLQAALRELDPR